MPAKTIIGTMYQWSSYSPSSLPLFSKKSFIFRTILLFWYSERRALWQSLRTK